MSRHPSPAQLLATFFGPAGSTPAFAETSCSQCGHSFGPGNHGFSHCDNHKRLFKAVRENQDRLRAHFENEAREAA